MKSRTSYFDSTVYKKDMTRFAPAWGFYTVCLFLGFVLMRTEVSSAMFYHMDLDNLPRVMAVINFLYALLNTQLLWGDLYNARLCNALHALPIRRETWFGSHTLAGLSFSLLPTLAAMPVALLLGIGSIVEAGWQLPFWWLLATNLQYLLFFGLGTLCAFCVGNRFAHALVYGITNFASVIVLWLVDTLYTPLLYGLQTPTRPFYIWCPCGWMSDITYTNVNQTYDHTTDTYTRAWIEMGDAWGYLAICAAVGIAFLAVGLWLYRRRKLECAGDFMAVKALEPVFCVVFPLLCGTLVHSFCTGVIYTRSKILPYILMSAGIVAGFFAAKMLLERNIRIFRRKTFVQLAALCVAFAATLAVTFFDPLGLVTWIPEHAAYVEVFPYHVDSDYSQDGVRLDDPADIENVKKIHQWALDNRDFTYRVEESTYAVPEEYDVAYLDTEPAEPAYTSQYITLRYHLPNGTVRSRYYEVDMKQLPGQLLTPWFSTLELLFPEYDGDYTPEAIAEKTILVSDGDSTFITDSSEIADLLTAIEADCKAGTMAQYYNFHRESWKLESTFYLEFQIKDSSPDNKCYQTITVFTDSNNTNRWLLEHGFKSVKPDFEEVYDLP